MNTKEENESYGPGNRRDRKEMKDTISFCDTVYGSGEGRYGCRCWECGNGWNSPLKRLSYDLEYLNRTEGRRLGLKIVADQVKEKFGTLRFYFSILRTYPPWTKIFSFPFLLLGKFLEKKVDYGYRYENWKRIPTKNLFLHSVKTSCFSLERFLDLSFIVEAARGKDYVFAYEHLDNTVDDMVNKAEKECFNLCEICGSPIGIWKDEPRCETKGWIRYVCKSCAEKNGWKYEERKSWNEP